MSHSSATALVLLGVGLSLVSCDRAKASADPERTAAAAASVTAPGARPPRAARVSRVVFVGKEHPCDCTKKRLESGWAALELALGTSGQVAVEHLKADTQPEQVERYGKQRPMMTLPALYFVDAQGSVLELLQGEVTAEQVSAVLGR